MLIIAFVLALSALILQGIVIPKLTLLAFAPYLALALMRLPWMRALWMSALAGCFLDLLSEDPMGMHALNYTTVTALLFRFRKPFSPEQPFHVSLITAGFSFLSTLLQGFLLFLFDRRIPFSGKWVFADLIGMPLIDALYAFVWFAAPLALCDWVRNSWVLFWLKRKNPSLTSH